MAGEELSKTYPPHHNSGAIATAIVMVIIVLIVMFLILYIAATTSGNNPNVTVEVPLQAPLFLRRSQVPVTPLSSRFPAESKPPYRTSHWMTPALYGGSEGHVSLGASPEMSLPVNADDSTQSAPSGSQSPLAEEGTSLLAPFPYLARVMSDGFYFGPAYSSELRCNSDLYRGYGCRLSAFEPSLKVSTVEETLSPLITGIDDLTSQIFYPSRYVEGGGMTVFLAKGSLSVTFAFRGVRPSIRSLGYQGEVTAEWQPCERSSWFDQISDLYSFSVVKGGSERLDFSLICGHSTPFITVKGGVAAARSGSYQLSLTALPNDRLKETILGRKPKVYASRGCVRLTNTDEGALEIGYRWTLQSLSGAPVPKGSSFLLAAPGAISPLIDESFFAADGSVSFPHPVYGSSSVVKASEWLFQIDTSVLPLLEDFPEVRQGYASDLEHQWRLDVGSLLSSELEKFPLPFARSLTGQATLLLIGWRLHLQECEAWKNLHRKTISCLAIDPHRFATDRAFDTRWGGLTTTADQILSSERDLSGPYSDHHRLYGHYLYAAAVCSRFPSPEQPDWLSHLSPQLEAMAYDIATVVDDSLYYPPWRHFDWIYGHSLDNGLNSYGEEGRFHSSPCEIVHSWYGLWLFGNVTGSSQIRAAGASLLTFETQATNKYYLSSRTDECEDAIAISRLSDTSRAYGLDFPSVCGNDVEPLRFPELHLRLLSDLFRPLSLSHFNKKDNGKLVSTAPSRWLKEIRAPLQKAIDSYQQNDPSCHSSNPEFDLCHYLLKDGSECNRRHLFQQVLHSGHYLDKQTPKSVTLWFISQ